jgi:hypothetical protein
LSIAYLDDVLNAVLTARHIHIEERAGNRVSAEYD